MPKAFSGTPVRFGVFTDIQYADKPDLVIPYRLPTPTPPAANGTADTHIDAPIRRYSEVLAKTDRVVRRLNENDVCLSLHLGDIVDGNETVEQTQRELSDVLRRLKALHKPILHVVGNHCLHAGRRHLFDALGLKDGYYVRDLSARWRVVVVDTLDVGLSREVGDPLRVQADQYMKAHAGEASAARWNGTLGSVQKEWLRGVIDETRRRGMKAIVCGHIPVYLSPGNGEGEEEGDVEEVDAMSKHVVWEQDVIAAMLTENADVVKAYFAGHFHRGGYVYRGGVHFVTFESLLDSQCDDGTCAVVDLFDDGIQVVGFGEITSRRLTLSA